MPLHTEGKGTGIWHSRNDWAELGDCNVGLQAAKTGESAEGSWPFSADATVMPRSAKSPKSQQGDRVPYVKAKSLYTSLQTWSVPMSNLLK